MNIVIIGHGGHSKVIRDLIIINQKNHIIGYLDDKFQEVFIKEGIYYGPISFLTEIRAKVDDMKVIIGIGNNVTRKNIAEKLNLCDSDYAILIHPTAVVSGSAKIEYGTVIMANTVINADVHIGRHVIINTGAIVEHDNLLSDYVHISPSATLTGSIQLKEGVHVGAGATIIPDRQIGEWSIIGAGATVIDHLPSHCTACGVPAKLIMKKVNGGV